MYVTSFLGHDCPIYSVYVLYIRVHACTLYMYMYICVQLYMHVHVHSQCFPQALSAKRPTMP